MSSPFGVTFEVKLWLSKDFHFTFPAVRLDETDKFKGLDYSSPGSLVVHGIDNIIIVPYREIMAITIGQLPVKEGHL